MIVLPAALVAALCSIGGPAGTQSVQKPTGPPPTPRHTGIVATIKNIGHDFVHVPSRQNLLIAGLGGAAALAVHPFDAGVNRHLRGSTAADHILAPGKYLGESYTLIGASLGVYAFGRIADEPKVSHLGMDLVRAIVVNEALTEALKVSVRRERPDQSNNRSFPSGHASTTLAIATALERHLGWRGAAPAYLIASYVASSRLHDNRHYLSDVVFGGAVGIIAGRTVTRHGSSGYVTSVVPVPGGIMVSVTRKNRPQ